MTGANTEPMGSTRREPEKKESYSRWNCPSCKFSNFERNTGKIVSWLPKFYKKDINDYLEKYCGLAIVYNNSQVD
jgi:ferredoxin-thioredoxin reductase catalytic subunit